MPVGNESPVSSRPLAGSCSPTRSPGRGDWLLISDCPDEMALSAAMCGNVWEWTAGLVSGSPGDKAILLLGRQSEGWHNRVERNSRDEGRVLDRRFSKHRGLVM